MGQLSATIDLAREVTAAEVAKAEDDANRVVWEDRPVSVRFATRGRSRGHAAAEGIGAHRTAAPDRRAGLRPVGVRRHARRAHRRDRRDRHRRLRRSSAADRASSSCAATARLQRFRAVARFAGGDAEAPVGAADRDGRVDRAHAGRGEGRCSARSAASRKSSPFTRPQRLLAKGSTTIVEALEGWDAQGLKAIAAAATAAQPAAVVVLFTTTTPALVVIARGANAERRCRRGVEAADGEVWREGWREARPRAGRRIERRHSGLDRRSRRSYRSARRTDRTLKPSDLALNFCTLSRRHP